MEKKTETIVIGFYRQGLGFRGKVHATKANEAMMKVVWTLLNRGLARVIVRDYNSTPPKGTPQGFKELIRTI